MSDELCWIAKYYPPFSNGKKTPTYLGGGDEGFVVSKMWYEYKISKRCEWYEEYEENDREGC